MSDKLLVEIDMHNGELGDAIPALIFLANELVESGTVEISNPVNWKEKTGNSYQVKWRFAEDELSSWQISLDADFLFQLNSTLKKIKVNIPENCNSAIENLQNQLESYLADSPLALSADGDY